MTLSTNRKGRITASNVGAILNCDPHRNRADVMRAMVREWNGAESEFKGNIATEHGNANELTAVGVYELVTGEICHEAEFITHPEYDWLGATPDRLTSTGLLEIKCPYGLRDKGEFKSIAAGDLPHYYAQVQIQLFCTQKMLCDFFQYATGTGAWKLETVTRDDVFLYKTIQILEEFYQSYLIEREFPHCEKHLAPKYEKVDNTELVHLCEQYKQIGFKIDALEDQKKELLKSIIKLCDEKPCQIGDFKLIKVEKEGSIKYAEAVKKLLPGCDLSEFKGNPSSYFMIK